MPIKKGREYRALQDFSLIPREGETTHIASVVRR